jgi:hypothetical protein
VIPTKFCKISNKNPAESPPIALFPFTTSVESLFLTALFSRRRYADATRNSLTTDPNAIALITPHLQTWTIDKGSGPHLPDFPLTEFRQSTIYYSFLGIPH